MTLRHAHRGRARRSAAFVLVPELFVAPMNTTILIVEDDDLLRSSLGRWAIKHMLKPLEAVSAEEALALLKTHVVGLAIVDKRLPGLDGLELAEQLIQAEAERPVVLMTAYADLDSARQAMNIGVYEYITKPFDLDDFAACVQRGLQHRELLLENRTYREQLETQVTQRTEELRKEIEERKKAEQALRNSEAQLRLITDSLPVFVSFVDANRCYKFINKKYEETFGITREDAYGKHVRDVLGDTNHERLKPYMDRVLEGERVEFEGPLPADSERTAFATYVPHTDSNGEVQGFFALILDVTERRLMENRLVQLERLGALAEMSEGVSHNLNNILTGILGPAQLIEFHTQEQEVLQEAKIIQKAALRAADLVKRLSVSVGSEGNTLIPVDVVQAIREAIDSAQPRWKDEAEAKGITIDIVTDLSPVPFVQATPRELHAVFLNLIFNAIDAMPNGGTLSVSSEVANDSIQITVVDTGIGMDEETRRRVFEPFFTTKADVGTGLGLSTVFTSITRWGGQIELKSIPGKGTSFVLNLPIWEEGMYEEIVQAQRSGSILVVEDEDMVRNFLVRVLERRHKVEAVESGILALELFSAGKFDVAMVDLGMPEMPGDRVTEHLRKIDPHVASVLITGWELDSDDPRRSVFDFHVKKPFDSVDKILNIVASAIQTRDARAGD